MVQGPKDENNNYYDAVELEEKKEEEEKNQTEGEEPNNLSREDEFNSSPRFANHLHSSLSKQTVPSFISSIDDYLSGFFLGNSPRP